MTTKDPLLVRLFFAIYQHQKCSPRSAMSQALALKALHEDLIRATAVAPPETEEIG